MLLNKQRSIVLSISNMIIHQISRNIFKFASKKTTIYHSLTDDIHFNLATEEYLYETELTNPTLFLWRNNKTIVIGRHQNPWKQCHLKQMEKDGVTLSRRITGGGAVYHDLGNTCFSFLTPYQSQESFDYKTVNNQILLSSLSKLGVSANLQGRNDITLEGKKISGSAYKLNLGSLKTGRARKALHHGTILFNVDTNALAKYLNPNKAKLLSKGVTSVKSRVTNLQQKFPEANHKTFSEAAQKSFLQHYKPDSVERSILDYQHLNKNGQIRKRYQQLKSWDWLYGKTPHFSNNIEHRFAWGVMDVSVDSENGIITDGVVYSDSLNPDFISHINELIKSGRLTYDFEGVNKLENSLRQQFPDAQSMKQTGELCAWLKQSI